MRDMERIVCRCERDLRSRAWGSGLRALSLHFFACGVARTRVLGLGSRP